MKSLLIRVSVITGIILALLIPVQLVKSLVSERKDRQAEVYAEMGKAWGSAATLAGVAIVKGGAYFVPEQQQISCEIIAEMRQKGIFKVPFYTANVSVKANIDPSAIRDKTDCAIILAYKGVVQIRSVTLGGRQIPASNAIADSPTSYRFMITGKAEGAARVPLKIDFTISGIDHLYFQQIAASTEISASSNWKDPNFIGASLPASRTVDSHGFNAHWQLANPLYSAMKKEFAFDEDESFGVGLFVPVSVYNQTDRVIKYAILFLVLTFVAFFLFEILNSLRIHPLQYLLVGAALTLFYLLLLSLSEHIDFAAAYVIASGATIGLIVMYCARIMGSRIRLVFTGTLLSGLYLFLFILLQLEQYSLLMGSVGLFALLGAVMYLTRNIDWYKPVKGK